ncbi:hypothetical protein [Amycolatopsis sp.]|uniref:hypothetical protein n=1 Tax=Amycolatopsis sp. TaxID=37632 RepID=UPI002BD9207D|nr:hypothetical protein [Amycolatopsis sp.]HVV10999.1 hypothetical protein [Amycolatopsis sp.]
MLRYGNTGDADQAAAPAHLLHPWTSPPRAGHDDLNPALDFRHIAYDAPAHLAELPAAAKQAVQQLTTDAEPNRGPWTASVTAPKEPQSIGTATQWAVTVHNPKGNGLAQETGPRRSNSRPPIPNLVSRALSPPPRESHT